MADASNRFVEGIPTGINYGMFKRHAIWLEEVKSRKWGSLRTAACGIRVQPQQFKGKKGQKYLKPWDPDGAMVCQKCLMVINAHTRTE